MTAAESTVKQQVAGFYRQRVGHFLVTALYDGFINLPLSLFHGLEAEKIKGLINRKFQPQTSDGLPTAVSTYLIDNGADLILINAGGDSWRGPTMGGMLESMKAAGYSPGDVSAILLTHLHFDHVCGLADPECRPAFPNAVVYASKDECRYWLTPQPQLIATKENRHLFHIATRAVASYRNKDAFIEFQDGEEIRPGLKAMLTPGHTPGHASFLLTSGPEQMLLWGDIVHSHALQFDHPEISNDFDSDQAQAVDTRGKLFKRIVQENWLIAGDHLPFPGFGHLAADGEKYSWVPVEYASLPLL